jgi:hypothetical protein
MAVFSIWLVSLLVVAVAEALEEFGIPEVKERVKLVASTK